MPTLAGILSYPCLLGNVFVAFHILCLQVGCFQEDPCILFVSDWLTLGGIRISGKVCCLQGRMFLEVLGRIIA